MAETIYQIFQESARSFPNQPALWSRGATEGGSFEAISYQHLAATVQALAVGLRSLGLQPGDHVGLISENRPEWLISDLALMALGAVDVPRGSEASREEVGYILRHAGCRAVLVEDPTLLEKLQDTLTGPTGLRAVILLIGEAGERATPLATVIDRGKALLAGGGKEGWARLGGDLPSSALATIIYTSGTTGRPKGVMLSHANLLHHLRVVPDLIRITPQDRFLSILPPWHIFERIVQYMAISRGASIAYSKPVSQILLPDLQAVQPTFIAGVPRIWEGLYQGTLRRVHRAPLPRRLLFHGFLALGRSHCRAHRSWQGLLPQFQPRPLFRRWTSRGAGGALACLLSPLRYLGDRLVFRRIRQVTGGRLQALISGGAALPAVVEDFFATIGLPVIEGYGLTEAAPIVSLRHPGRPVPYTVGPPIPGTEVQIVDDHDRLQPVGVQGVIKIRGPQVMLGYYQDEPATRALIDDQGWLNTGDLGRLTLGGELQFCGRAKDTIVLSSGENIEPEPLEQRLQESPYIRQVMLVGQDRKFLGALIVPDLEALAQALGSPANEPHLLQGLLVDERVARLIQAEIRRLLSHRNGFKRHERISRFHLLAEEFQVGRELTHTLKLRRKVILDRYKHEVELLYHHP